MNFEYLTDMLEVYFECGKRPCDAIRIYQERFPDRESPHHKKFARLEANLRMYGSFKKPKKELRTTDENLDLNVLLMVAENPKTSVREIANNIGSSSTTVHSILKKHKLRPYKPQLIHHLLEDDYPRRMQFCNFYLNKLREDPLFYSKILWSDECTFTNNAIFNRNNHRYWSNDNPRFLIENNIQRRFSLNVWCGMLDSRLIGPYFIDGNLNQEKYHTLLEEIVDNLEELPIAQYAQIYFQQDGAAPHNALINTQFLNRQFDRRWIGTYGPIRWPARSPDLSPLDFFLWNEIREIVYVTQPENVDDLRNRIVNAFRQILPNNVLNAAVSVGRRCRLCIGQNGAQFEQYL